ncbi:hypothetical protein PM082_011028 [Marasmius tenuissimus]|nr:hypothetical protein PM082_011028 [Marasmius tenuissimus]
MCSVCNNPPKHYSKHQWGDDVGYKNPHLLSGTDIVHLLHPMALVSHQVRVQVRALMFAIEIDWTVPWLNMHETERAVVGDLVMRRTKNLSV